jgi:hypothetical protein
MIHESLENVKMKEPDLESILQVLPNEWQPQIKIFNTASDSGFSVRFPNFVSLKIEPYGKKKIQRVVLHQA